MSRKFSLIVARNSAFGMMAQVAIKALSFAFSVLIVRNLGADAFGQYTAVLAFGTVFAIFSDLGLAPYAVRQIARWRNLPDGAEQTGRLYGNMLALRLLLAVATSLALIATAWLTNRPVLMIGAIAINSTTLLLYGVQGSSESVLAGFERLDLTAGVKVLNQLVFVAVGTLALVAGLGYYGLILANVIGVALMAWVSWQAVRRLGVRPQRVVTADWRKLLRASLPFGVIGLALGLSYRFDSVLLNIFRSDAETGYYNAAYNLVFSAVLVSNVFNAALYPSVTRQATVAPGALPKIYGRALRYLLVMSLPIAIGGWALADRIIPFLFDEAYRPAIPAFQIIIWVTPLMFASELLGYIVVIDDKENRAARAILVSTGLNVVMNLLLVPALGFVAAAVMTVVTEAVLVGQYLWLQRAMLRRLDWGRTLVRPLIAALTMGAAVLALRPYLDFPVNVAAGVAVYAVLLIALGVVGRDELRFVRGARVPADEPVIDPATAHQ